MAGTVLLDVEAMAEVVESLRWLAQVAANVGEPALSGNIRNEADRLEVLTQTAVED